MIDYRILANMFGGKNMFNLIKELRNNDYSDELFVVGGISETKVEELARKLNVTFTNSYKEFLMEFGRIIGYGVDILGCGLFSVK